MNTFSRETVLVVMMMIVSYSAVHAVANPQPVYVIVGPSGVGKSTVINCLNNQSSAGVSGSLQSHTANYALYQFQDMLLMDTRGFGDNMALLKGVKNGVTGSTDAILDTLAGIEKLSRISAVVYFANSFGRVTESELNSQKIFFSAFSSTGVPRILVFNQCSDFSCKQAKSNYQQNKQGWQALLGDHEVAYVERHLNTNPNVEFHPSHIDAAALRQFFVTHSLANPPVPFSLVPTWKEDIIAGDPIAFAAKMKEHHCASLRTTAEHAASASDQIHQLQTSINSQRSSILAELSPSSGAQCAQLDTSHCISEILAETPTSSGSSGSSDGVAVALSATNPVVSLGYAVLSFLNGAPDPVILRSSDPECVQKVTESYSACLMHLKEDQERITTEFQSNKDSRLSELEKEQAALELKFIELEKDKELLHTRLQKCAVN